MYLSDGNTVPGVNLRFLISLCDRSIFTTFRATLNAWRQFVGNLLSLNKISTRFWFLRSKFSWIVVKLFRLRSMNLSFLHGSNESHSRVCNWFPFSIIFLRLGNVEQMLFVIEKILDFVIINPVTSVALFHVGNWGIIVRSFSVILRFVSVQSVPFLWIWHNKLLPLGLRLGNVAVRTKLKQARSPITWINFIAIIWSYVWTDWRGGDNWLTRWDDYTDQTLIVNFSLLSQSRE